MVVFVHGGYSRALDRRWLEPVLGTFGNIGVSLAERGVGAALIGYRQYPSIQHAEDSLTDIAAAIRFVRDSCPARFVELPGLGHNQIMIGIGMDDDPIVPLFRVHALNACARRPNRPEGTAVRADARPMRPPGRRRRLVLTRKTRNCAEAV